MEYSNFKLHILDQIKEHAEDGDSIRTQTIIKNNNSIYDALIVMKKNSNIAPTIYFNSYYELYQNGTSLSDIVDQILRDINSDVFPFPFNLNAITDFSFARNLIAYKLVNYESNKELLKTVPHRRILDLAMVYYLLLQNDENGNASAIITNDHLYIWGETEESIYSLAVSNTPRLLNVTFMSLYDLMHSLVKQDLILQLENSLFKNLNEETLNFLAADILLRGYDNPKDNTMYVITNEAKLNGFSSILYPDTLSRAADMIGEDFYILPSSVHECILLPASTKMAVCDIISMVYHINKTSVSNEEKLSDTIYYYDMESSSISCINSPAPKYVLA